MNKEINILELACELAHDRTKDELNIIDSADMYVQDADSYVYTEEIQDVFNKWFDYYFSKIDEL